MFIATLVHRTWLTNDLADIRDDLKKARRDIFRLVADCFHFSLNCASRTITDFRHGLQSSDQTYAFRELDDTQPIPRSAIDRRTGLFVACIAGVTLAALVFGYNVRRRSR